MTPPAIESSTSRRRSACRTSARRRSRSSSCTRSEDRYEQNQALEDVSFTVERRRVLRRHRAERQRQEHAAEDRRGHLPRRLRRGARRRPALALHRARRRLPPRPERARQHPHQRHAARAHAERARRSGSTRSSRFAELERFVDQKLKNYSSGMQVRLAFSIAIQVPFDVLLLDEVLAVGDQLVPGEVLRDVRALPRGGQDDRARQPRPRRGRRRTATGRCCSRTGVCVALGPGARGGRAVRAPRARRRLGKTDEARLAQDALELVGVARADVSQRRVVRGLAARSEIELEQRSFVRRDNACRRRVGGDRHVGRRDGVVRGVVPARGGLACAALRLVPRSRRCPSPARRPS